MELNSVLDFATKYASDYLSTFAGILASPKRGDWPIRIYKSRSSYDLLEPKESNLPVSLLAFVAISISLGCIIASTIPDRRDTPGIMPTIVITVAFWIAFSSLLYLLCRILGGKGHYQDTIAVGLQVFSVLYVLSTFSTLILSVSVGSEVSLAELSGDDWRYIETPSLYFLIHAALLGVYLPVILKRIHGLTWSQEVLVAVPFALLLGFIGWSLYQETGIDYYPPTQPWWMWWM